MREHVMKEMKDKKAKVSVIVPVYNAEQFLGKCIDSIIGQTYKNIELILVDDGSSDSSGRICDEYAEKDARIKVIHQKNSGVSAARNAGMASAAGDLYFFVDSDDYIPVDSIESLHMTMEGYDADISIGIEEYFRYKGGREAHWKRPFRNPSRSICMDTKAALKELLRQKTISGSAWGKLYKKHVFSEVTFPEGHMHESKATVYRTFMKAKKIVLASGTTYFYQIREDGLTRGTDSKNKCEDMIRAVEKQCSDIQECYPELRREADIRRLDAYFHAFINSGENESEEFKADCWKQVERLRWGALLSPAARSKTRIAALLSLPGPRLFTLISSKTG